MPDHDRHELWDARDRDGRLLGFDLVRGLPLPPHAYHMIVEVYTVTPEKRILVTRRDRTRRWPFYWEVTAGSLLKGESPEGGAVRELEEETGIIVGEAALIPICQVRYISSIYRCFVAPIKEEDPQVRLQAGETIDYRFLLYPDFKRFLLSEEFAPPVSRRFYSHEDLFDRAVKDGGCFIQKGKET